MTAPGLDERDHLTAIKSALTTLHPHMSGHLYSAGLVPGATGPDGSTNPGTLPDWWVQIHLERRFAAPSKMGKRAHRSGWRLILRAVDSHPDNTRLLLSQVADLEGTRLTVDTNESTPLLHEPVSGGEVKPDDGFFSAASGFTYLI